MADPSIDPRELTRLEEEWKSGPSQMSCARLADMLRQSGRFDEAVVLAKEGLRKWPASTSIEIVMGKCCRESGKLENAMDAFRSVLKRQPLNLVALRSMAEISFQNRNWREAVDHFEEYLLEHPGDQEARDMLDEARSRCERVPAFEMNELDESSTGEEETAEEETSEEVIFPGTDRMRQILAEQGLPVEGHDQQGTDQAGDRIDRNLPEEAASLLDLFTMRERSELDLRSFEGELE